MIVLLLGAGLAVIGFALTGGKSMQPKGPAYWTPLLSLWAREENLDPAWILATVKVESNFNPDAVNKGPGDGERGGAWGLGQMTLKTARGLGYSGSAEGLLDPRTNIRLVAALHKQNGAPGANPQDVFSRYNSGKDFYHAPTVTRQTYVPRAMDAFNFYSRNRGNV